MRQQLQQHQQALQCHRQQQQVFFVPQHQRAAPSQTMVVGATAPMASAHIVRSGFSLGLGIGGGASACVEGGACTGPSVALASPPSGRLRHGASGMGSAAAPAQPAAAPQRREGTGLEGGSATAEGPLAGAIAAIVPVLAAQVHDECSGDTDLTQDSVPELAKGELMPSERIAYADLNFVEHLGSGEFGQVFRGFFKGQEVAIKQLYWDNTVLPEVVIQELTKEIESFRHLRHKRLVRFVGACLQIPNLCLVTEYMPGGSLYHLLHVRKIQLPTLHGINMCLQLADGVLYLHSRSPVVVHRDLKSLNVVLDLGLNVKLCDFGLTESMDRTHLTKKNNGGSPRYMAPELFDSQLKITEKVDVWSMGCIFTEIFGGPLPYEGINTLADLTREMLVKKRIPDIPPGIPEPVEGVVRSCYAFDGRLRPTASQVFHRLWEAKRQLRSQGAL